MSLIWFYRPTFAGTPRDSIEDTALQVLCHARPKKGFKISRCRGPATGTRGFAFATVPIPQPDALNLDLKSRFKQLLQPCDRWLGAYGSKIITMKERSKVPLPMILQALVIIASPETML